MLRWCACLVILLWSPGLFAGTLVLDEDFQSANLNSYMEVAWGDSASLDWRQNGPARIQSGYTSENQWVRFAFQSPKKAEKLVLEVSSASIPKMWVYTRTAGESYELLGHVGSEYLYSQRKVDYRLFIFRMKPAAAEKVELLIKIENDGQNRIYPFFLHTHASFHQQRLYRKIGMGILYGMIGLILGYGLIALSVLKSEIRPYYLGYVAAGAILFTSYSGLGYRIFWPGSPYIQQIMVLIMECVTNIFAISLALRLFRIRLYFPKIYKVSIRMCYVLGAMSVIHCFTPFYGPSVLWVTNQLTYLLILIVQVSFLTFPVYIFYKLQRKQAITFLFTIGLLCMALVPVILEHMGLFRLSINMDWVILIGSVIVNVSLWLLMLARVRENLLRDARIAEGGAHQQKLNMLILLQQEAVVRSKIKAEITQRVGLRLNSVSERIENIRSDTENKALKEGLAEALGALNTSNKELRGITENRVPSNLLELGLMGAIKEITLPVEQTGTSVELFLPSTEALSKLDIIYQLTIFRIIQGLLNNVYKHAKAKSVLIQMTINKGNFALFFKDNGIGYDSKKVGEGKGLEIIRKRVEAVEGSLNITSKKGMGSRFDVSIPIKF